MSYRLRRIVKIYFTFLKDLYSEFRRPNYYTDILKINCNYNNGWVGGCWEVENESGGYHGLFKMWWDYFKLKGKGLVIGEEGIYGENLKNKLKKTYPEIEVFSSSLNNADIIWDITKPLNDILKFDWIVCQAVLEHVIDPISAIKNMTDALKEDGYLYIHTHGPSFEYHPYPIDCYRFFKDAFIFIADILNLEIADIFWRPDHCFIVYKKSASISLTNHKAREQIKSSH